MRSQRLRAKVETWLKPTIRTRWLRAILQSLKSKR